MDQTWHDDTKSRLHRQLDRQRDALLMKLRGLGGRDLRRPMTPTGTNLLGLVRHVSGVEAGYFGETFGRPLPEPLPWDETYADNDDMWVPRDVPATEVLAFYDRVRAHADATIRELPLDAPGSVPWWAEGGREVTLLVIMGHVTTDVSRHAGHADILRETIDGEAGYLVDNDNLMSTDPAYWADLHRRLREISDSFGA